MTDLPDNHIDISGLPKGMLLVRLHAAAQAVGMGHFASDRGDLTHVQAEQLVGDGWIDYVGGKPIKTNLLGDTARVDLYDRDHGFGAFAAVVEQLRSEMGDHQ